MINVKEATQIALDYFADLFKGKRVVGLELEEVEKTEDDQYWLITLGFHIERPPEGMENLIGGLMGTMKGSPTTPRQYKTFRITADTGECVAMKIRNISGAN